MRFYKVLIVVLLSAVIFSCEKDDDTTKTTPNQNTGAETAKLNVYLTDAPGDYKSVYIDIQDVEVKLNDTATNGWTSLDSINKGIYDLLTLSNGLDTLLGNTTLPAGKLNQIRLILGSNNSLVLKNNDSIPLNTPSAQQSGLKLNINDSLVAGITYDIILDFDACKSIVKAGNSGKYNLKPVIRTIVNATSGSIKGIVQPDSIISAVMAISGIDTIGTFTDTSGAFLIRGLNPGTYDVKIDPGSTSGLNDTTITGVGVTLGNTTDIGTVQL